MICFYSLKIALMLRREHDGKTLTTVISEETIVTIQVKGNELLDNDHPSTKKQLVSEYIFKVEPTR